MAQDPGAGDLWGNHSRGRVCFVLHSHLPWVLGHGNWPVGEEWLYQAYAHSYMPLLQSLSDLSDRGFRNIASLGITPVLGAQLDHVYALNNLHIWLHDWQLRATQIPRLHPAYAHTLESASHALNLFQQNFSRGASPVIRRLIDAQAVEVLGGPLAHPFTPLLDPTFHSFVLAEGLKDAQRRWGSTPTGVWVPECAYRPGQENTYQEFGVTHFLVDQSAVTTAGGLPNVPYALEGSSVVVIARDVGASDLVWSAERGYPGRSEYLDFHDVNTRYGLRLSRVGEKSSIVKNEYDPAMAREAVFRDAQEFISDLSKILESQEQSSSPNIPSPNTPIVVIAIDTELLGHWWHEGVQWFTQVIELLPASGIETVTLEQATQNPSSSIALGETSWGEGKDWRLWTSDPVRDLVVMNHSTQRKILESLEQMNMTSDRESALLNEAVLQISSDWAFMVSRDSAAEYGRNRSQQHYSQFNALLSDPQINHRDSHYPFSLSWPRA